MSLIAAIARARASLSPGSLTSSALTSPSNGRNGKLGVGSAPWTRTASQITPSLYLSDLWTACNAEEIEKLGVTHIVSAIEHRPALPDCVPVGRRLQIFIADRGDANIFVEMEGCTKWIGEAIEGGGVVLVHCAQGISRSATLVCAYLCFSLGMDAADAIAYVQERRAIVCPNAGFRVQLARYARPFVRAAYRPKGREVGEGVRRRIGMLFPGKKVKGGEGKGGDDEENLGEELGVGEEEGEEEKSEAEVMADEAVERAFGRSAPS